MKKYFALITILFFALSFAEDSVLPAMKLKNLDKKTISTKDIYKDGPVLINFWGLSCEPCKKEMKYLEIFHNKYQDQNFNVVSINIDSPRSASKVKSYIKSQKYSFEILSDPKSAMFRKTGGKVMPYSLLVDANGTIVKRHMGYSAGDEIKIEKEIRHLLKLDNTKEMAGEK